MREDLDKKEEALNERDKNITELYKHIEEIQQMISNQENVQAVAKLEQCQREQLDEDERRIGNIKTELQEEDLSDTLSSAAGSIPEDKDMKADNQQALSGSQASNKMVIQMLTIMRVISFATFIILCFLIKILKRQYKKHFVPKEL